MQPSASQRPAPRRTFRLQGVDVYISGSAGVGFALLAWFAHPTALEVVGGSGRELAAWALACFQALMIYISVIAHEWGHARAALHYGYPVTGIAIHVLGGHTGIGSEFRRSRHQFAIAIAGPAVTGIISILSALLAANSTGVVNAVVAWLAWSSGLLTVINLLPGIPLDGGSIVQALVWRFTKSRETGLRAAAISGIGIGVLWAVSPFLFALTLGAALTIDDVLLSGLVGAWLAFSAWAALAAAKASGKATAIASDFSTTPVSPLETHPVSQASITAREVARRCISVTAETPVASAIVQAHDAKAGAIVVSDGTKVIGITRDSAVAMLSEEQKAVTSITQVSRRVSDEDFLNVETTLGFESPILSMPYASEWIVVDDKQKIFGVVTRKDIIEALTTKQEL